MQVKESRPPKEEEGFLELFMIYKGLYVEKEQQHEAREVGYLGRQTIVDGTERVKVVEIEKEEALKKVEGFLRELKT